MTNPLLQTLQIIETLSRFDASIDTLANQVNCSEPTAKRYIKEARAMGADIVAARVGGIFVYELRNWDACRHTVTTWIELEKARKVV